MNNFVNFLSQQNIGNHISSLEYLSLFNRESTVQFYLTDEVKCNLNPIREYVEQNNLRLYIHGYLQNNLTSSSIYFVNKFLEEMRIAKYLGARGLVIHMGYVKEGTYQECLQRMYINIKRILQEATITCPLLIETPAGETNRLCSNFEEMLSFINLFNNEEKAIMGLCVDTAHVWGAGYNPQEYLQAWTEHSTFPIKLLHFNDSKVERNSKKDRHAKPGEGTIGIPILYSVFIFCYNNQIPMVREN